MSKRKQKKKSSFDLAQVLNGFLLLVALGNIIAIVCFELSRKPRVDKVFTTVTTNHVIVVTNYLSGVSSSPAPAFLDPTNSLSPGSVTVQRVPYKLYFWGGRPYVTIGGFEFGVGSPTSFGRIQEIYPDRFLTDRCWVENSSFGSSLPSMVSKSGVAVK